MPAAKAAAAFRVPDGFRVRVFASEPDVQNPIAMAWDARGRLWIAENYTYAERALKFDLRHRDRVLVRRCWPHALRRERNTLQPGAHRIRRRHPAVKLRTRGRLQLG